MLAAFLGKVGYETATGTTLFVDSHAAGFIPLAIAHLVGGCAGVAATMVPTTWLPQPGCRRRHSTNRPAPPSAIPTPARCYDELADARSSRTSHTVDMADDEPLLPGVLHAFIAFDWGGGYPSGRVRQLWPARSGELARRPRTPASIAYRPAPLHFDLAPVTITLAELGAVQASAEARAFDFRA